MKIRLSEILEGKTGILPIENKTLIYLSPCMREYGDEFKERYKHVFKIALGIGDKAIDGYTNQIFILCYTGIRPLAFIGFLDWVKTQPFYESDYVFGNTKTSPLHMVVVKCPDGYMQKFRAGQYSQMYTPEQIEDYFHKRPKAKKVVSKSPSYHEEFVALVNQLFNTDMLPEEYDGEYDFKPNIEDESFE